MNAEKSSLDAMLLLAAALPPATLESSRRESENSPLIISCVTFNAFGMLCAPAEELVPVLLVDVEVLDASELAVALVDVTELLDELPSPLLLPESPHPTSDKTAAAHKPVNQTRIFIFYSLSKQNICCIIAVLRLIMFKTVKVTLFFFTKLI